MMHTVKGDALDENDNDPFFEPQEYSRNISEHFPTGTAVLEVFAFDLDKGLQVFPTRGLLFNLSMTSVSAKPLICKVSAVWKKFE